MKIFFYSDGYLHTVCTYFTYIHENR